MNTESFEFLEEAIKIAERFIKQEEKQAVLPYQSPEDLAQKLDITIQNNSLEKTLFFQILQEIALATPSTASKGFFNQLYGGRSMPALSGDILSSLMNNSMYTFKVAGLQVLIEKEVIRAMCEKIGFTSSEGTIVAGGSTANLTAMLLARNEQDKSIRNEGLQNQKLIAYTSEESHYSIRKNAGILGLGRNQVKTIPTLENGKMNTQALEKQILEDIENGLLPFFINSTAGTTVLGAFDPFEEIAEIAQKYDCWFHIDGAFGGSVLLSEKYKQLIKGSEKADSFTWNAHKMMNIPLTASGILCKEKGVLRRNLSENADYLFQGEYDYNPGEESLQCGRRNDGLKIWSAWKYYGHEGYEQRINKVYELAQYAVRKVKENAKLSLLQEPECTTVCFEILGKNAQEVCDALNQKGILKVGYGTRKEKTFVRVVFVNPDLDFEDVDAFFEKLES